MELIYLSVRLTSSTKIAKRGRRAILARCVFHYIKNIKMLCKIPVVIYPFKKHNNIKVAKFLTNLLINSQKPSQNIFKRFLYQLE